MKQILFLLIIFCVVTNMQAQNTYEEAIQMGDKKLEEGNFKEAMNYYFAAEAFDPTKKDIVKTKVNNVFDKINSLKIEAEESLVESKEMQAKMETAIFDKAIKDKHNEWKGYANYLWKYKNDENTKNGLEILNKIDTLDLSNNVLLRLPKELTECPNLKHINLLGNNDIDWKTSENTLSKLGENVNIYVSVNDLDSIPKQYWYLY